MPIIVFRPDIDLSHDNDETYTGKLDKIDELKIWAQDKCVPLVRYILHCFMFCDRKVDLGGFTFHCREITFENAEELTEEGLPFLILFHAQDDTESIKNYKAIVESQLLSEKRKLNNEPTMWMPSIEWNPLKIETSFLFQKISIS